MDVQREIRRFIEQDLKREVAVDDADSLLEAGILDSIGVLQVVGFIEKQYGITVTDEEMMPDNFETLAAIAAFVERRQRAVQR